MAGHSCISDTRPEHWRYVAEGGATIVFAYVGPPQKEFTGMVLRLRKTSQKALQDPSVLIQNEIEEPDDPSIAFHEIVIRRLIPAEFLPQLVSVRTKREWLAKLAQISDAERPIERRRNDKINLSRTKAVIATDLIGKNNLAVELKPKWGFLPSPTFLSPSTRPVKTSVCRFCMHVHLKDSRAQPVATGFCPLDLYSNDEARVRRALSALWDSWIASNGEINNLRIFVNGDILKPVDKDPAFLITLAHFLVPTPTADSMQAMIQPAEDLRKQFIEIIAPVLMESSALEILSVLQSNLDALDIEGLAALWERAHSHLDIPPDLGAGEPEPNAEEWRHFVDKYLSRIAEKSGRTENFPQTSEVRYHLLAYLLSATFKDCSIMLTIPPIVEGRARPDYSIKLIDLDTKTISRLAKWEKRDKEIVTAYMTTHSRMFP